MKKLSLNLNVQFMALILSILSLTTLPLLTSCEHKELCYDHSHEGYSRIFVDWKGFPESPTGMSVLAYPCLGGEPKIKLTNETHYADLNISDGMYHIMVFNQSYSEFTTIVFREMEAYKTATAHAVDRGKSWYSRAEDERVVHDIEYLGSGTLEDIEVDNQKLHKQLSARSDDSRLIVEKGTIHPGLRTVNIKVTVYVKGIQNLRSVRGSLDGLAGGCTLSDGKPIGEKVTHLLEKWNLKIDEKDPTRGQLIGTISTFGLPKGHHELSEENTLKLSTLLIDDKTIMDFSFEVGERFEVNTEIGLELDLKVGTDADDGPIKLPDVKPIDGGGFDVNIDDWGDVENIEIPM